MMKKYGYSPEQVMQSRTVLRNEANPNTGFRNQLKLWQKMNFTLIGSDREYRLLLVASLKNRLVVIAKYAQNEKWEVCSEALHSAFICYLQKVMNAEENCKPMDRGKTYRCSGCSHELFEEVNEIRNSEAKEESCQHIYVEPVKWILHDIMANAKDLKQTLKGTITCGQCKQELGAFDWHNNGFNCECEAHKGLNYYIDIQIEANKVTK